MISFCLLNATLHSSKHQTSLLSLHWIEFSFTAQKVKSSTQGRGHQIGGSFTPSFLTGTQRHKHKPKQSENWLWWFSFASFLARVKHTQTDGSWGWVYNAIWFHTSDENTSAHHYWEKWEKRRRMSSHDMTRGKKGSQQGEKEKETIAFAVMYRIWDFSKQCFSSYAITGRCPITCLWECNSNIFFFP